MAIRELTFPLVPRRRLVGLAFGAMHSARRGTGSDVAGSRPYVRGDDVNSIDWNASARLSSARASDDFVVRERYAEDAPRVLLVCDRRPAMALYPAGWPWLSKPDAVQAVGELIAESTVHARGFVGYLDFANVEHPVPAQRTGPFWRPPRSHREHWRLRESHLRHPSYFAPEDNLTQAFQLLIETRHSLPAGSFVFVLSDFLACPPTETWLAALEHRWDVVPVIVQDPVWERSFPPVGSVVVPLADPTDGRIVPVRLSAREVRERRESNERRYAELVQEFLALDLEPVVVSTSDAGEVLHAFLTWADHRLYTVRRGWQGAS